LNIKGEGVEKVKVSPWPPYLGKVSSDKRTSASITLQGGANLPDLKVREVSSDSPYFQFQSRAMADKKTALDVTTIEPLPLGRIAGIVNIVTDNPEYPKFRLQISATVIADIDICPQEIHVLKTDKEMPEVVRYITVEAAPGVDLELVQIESPDDDMQMEIAERINAFRIVVRNIRVTPELAGKTIDVTVRVDEEERLYRIPFKVTTLRDGKS